MSYPTSPAAEIDVVIDRVHDKDVFAGLARQQIDGQDTVVDSDRPDRGWIDAVVLKQRVNRARARERLQQLRRPRQSRR
jgi:hypothetical protein